MNEQSKSEFFEYAKTQYPKEACGVLVIVKGKERVFPCNNLSPTPGDEFMMCPVDYSNAEEKGEIVGIIHSHVNLPPIPSQADLVSCEATGMEWHIVCVPTGEWHSFEPSGYVAPLIGRIHCWNVLDCWTLVCDWYQRERGIVLFSVDRHRDFWKDGTDLLGSNVATAGFRNLRDDEEMQEGDVIFMQTGDSTVANHVALYLGDGKIMHHAENRLSSRDVYGGWYRKHTVRVIRYVA